MNLFNDFDPTSKEEWVDKIITDLKGAPLESLNWESEIGDISPVIHSYEPKYKRINDPISSNHWDILYCCNHTKDNLANKEILKSLSAGASRIRVNAISKNFLDTALNDVMTDIIKLDLLLDADEDVIEYANRNFTVNNYYKNCISSASNLSLASAETVKQLVNVDLLKDSGASFIHELSLALSIGHEALLYNLKLGLNINKAVERIAFNFSVGNSFLMEIAKLKAFKTLWYTITHSYGYLGEFNTEIFTQNSSLYYTSVDVYNNLLRATAQTMSASVAGCNAISVIPYDTYLNTSKENSERLAVNIQHILKEESFLDKVKDASRGAYYVEYLTDQLIEKAYARFKELEDMGGYDKLSKSGEILSMVASDLQEKVNAYNEKEIVLVGANIQPNQKETNPEQIEDYNFSSLNRYRLSKLKV